MIAKRFFSLTLLCCTITMIMAQGLGGKYLESLTMKSDILGQERSYSIYLPPDYDVSNRLYPVLYLLNPSGADHTSWEQNGNVKETADKGIANGNVTPMIIVMPDGHDGYFNNLIGTWRYEDFFFLEFMPYIEKTYKVRAKKAFRAVCGSSMGGGGAIGYAIRHTDMFAASCPLSAAPGPRDYNEYLSQIKRKNGDDVVKKFTKEQLQTDYQEQNFIVKFGSLKGEQYKNVCAINWYFDCGDNDHLSARLADMHSVMFNNKIPHEYRAGDGRHEWKYWREALRGVLRFISEVFSK